MLSAEESLVSALNNFPDCPYYWTMKRVHGGIDSWQLKRLGMNPDDVLDFSVSINPAPLPSSMKDAIQRAAISRYPDSRSRELVEAIAETYACPEDEILVVNGTSQAMYLIAGTFLSQEKTSLIAAPAFSGYRNASEAFGAPTIEHHSLEKDSFIPNVCELSNLIAQKKPSVFWLCRPNNPTGIFPDNSLILDLHTACRDAGGLFVLDEAYRCFTDPSKLTPVSSSDGSSLPNLITLFSMTKDFCIPGLRLGWLRAKAEIVNALALRQPAWSVSAPAQEAGIAALKFLEYFRESWSQVRSDTEKLSEEITGLGLKVFPTDANFILVRAGSDAYVKKLSAFLRERKILVRDCASFGLEGFIRIGCRSESDNRRLVQSLREFSA